MKLRLDTPLSIRPRMPLALTGNPLLEPRRATHAQVEREMQTLPHLAGDRRAVLKAQRRQARDARKAADAVAAIGALPGPDEALHLLISGRFALWHVVPAVAKLAAQPIAELRIATLGFNNQNIDDLCGMIDAGQVRTAKLLASHYFRSTSPAIYQHAREQFDQRADRASFLSLRSHAKLLLLRLDDARTFTVESSANLRSCGNLEQLAIIADPDLYEFHRAWLDELFTAAAGTEGARPQIVPATRSLVDDAPGP